MVLNASEVRTIITKSPAIVSGLKIVLTPEISEPITQIITPVITALIAPARLSPSTSSANAERLRGRGLRGPVRQR